MTKPDANMPNAELDMTTPAKVPSMALLAVLIAATFLTTVFGAGVVAGFTDAGGGDSPKVLAAIYAVWIAIVGGFALSAARVWLKRANGSKQPLSRSTRRSRSLMYVLVAFSAVIGMFLAYFAPEGTSLLSDGPIPAYPALILIMLWLVGGPIVTILWWRMTDEHDRASYVDGANIAGHAYLFITPGWWVATRAGLLPEQNPMVVLLIVAVIWSAVWFYRRYS